jgi:hypothetical protein
MRTSTSRLRPAPSPLGTNHAGLYLDSHNRLVHGRRGLALDAFVSPETDPLKRLRVYLHDLGLSSDRDAEQLLDELERERGGGAG